MIIRLLLIGAYLFLPTVAWAAVGDDCKATIGGTDFNRSGVHCKVLYDWDTADDLGPVVKVPLTTSACSTWVVLRSVAGTFANLDDWQVVSLDDDPVPTNGLKHIIAVFDGDGTVTAGLCPGDVAATGCGETYKHIQGPVLPYMQLVPGTTSAITDFLVYIIQYECSAP